MISANGDHEIDDMLAKAMDKVGREDVITVEGMQFDRGYL